MLIPVVVRRVAATGVVLASVMSCSVADRAGEAAERYLSSEGYCAMMTDSIGLYPGNAVSRRGIPIGHVQRVENASRAVRVVFALDQGVSIPADTSVLTRSPSILADRTLELTGGNAEGELLPGDCVPIERTATTKSITESTAAMTNLVNQMTDAGSGDTMNRLVSAAAAQLDGTGEPMRDAMTNFAGFMDNGQPPFDADQLLRDVKTLMVGLDTHWSDLELVLKHASPGLDSMSLGMFKTAAQLLGPPINTIFQTVLDVTTHLHDLVWDSLETGAKTIKLLSEHTGVIVMYAGTLPNILDGVRNFWARIRTFDIPVLSPRVAAGPQDNGRVCSQTDMDPERRDHCGFFYGVPDEITSVDMLQLVLNGGVPQP